MSRAERKPILVGSSVRRRGGKFPDVGKVEILLNSFQWALVDWPRPSREYPRYLSVSEIEVVE